MSDQSRDQASVSTRRSGRSRRPVRRLSPHSSPPPRRTTSTLQLERAPRNVSREGTSPNGPSPMESSRPTPEIRAEHTTESLEDTTPTMVGPAVATTTSPTRTPTTAVGLGRANTTDNLANAEIERLRLIAREMVMGMQAMTQSVAETFRQMSIRPTPMTTTSTPVLQTALPETIPEDDPRTHETPQTIPNQRPTSGTDDHPRERLTSPRESADGPELRSTSDAYIGEYKHRRTVLCV